MHVMSNAAIILESWTLRACNSCHQVCSMGKSSYSRLVLSKHCSQKVWSMCDQLLQDSVVADPECISASRLAGIDQKGLTSLVGTTMPNLPERVRLLQEVPSPPLPLPVLHHHSSFFPPQFPYIGFDSTHLLPMIPTTAERFMTASARCEISAHHTLLITEADAWLDLHYANMGIDHEQRMWWGYLQGLIVTFCFAHSGHIWLTCTMHNWS